MNAIASGNEIQFNYTGGEGEERLSVHLHRTLRLPEDGRTHALPPSLGHFPLRRIEDYRDRVPAAWREHGGVFFPMWQREAMWLSFSMRGRPFALKVAAGKVNAVSGEAWEEGLADGRQQTADSSGSGSYRTPDPGPRTPSVQDYLVVPPQPWLDGFNTGKGKIRQFVAMPLGMGYTVEAQVMGKEDVGGLQLLAMPPKDGLLVPRPISFPRPQYMEGDYGVAGAAAGGPLRHRAIGSNAPRLSATRGASPSYSAGPILESSTLDSWSGTLGSAVNAKGAEMGLAQGGEMVQKIYPDPHGIDTWKIEARMRVFIHIVNSQLYREITGEAPPPSPITAKDYAAKGYPWFEVWDQELGDVAASSTLAGVKTVGQKDAQHGFKLQDDSPVYEKVVSAGQVTSGGAAVKEGKEW